MKNTLTNLRSPALISLIFVVPIVRSARMGDSLLVDQMACFLGVPNCD